MILAFKIKEKYKEILPSAIHVDGTADLKLLEKKIIKNFIN